METYKVTHTHIQKEDSNVKTEADWRDAATSQGIPRIAVDHQKLGRGIKGFFLRATGGRMALSTEVVQIPDQ